MMNQGQPNFESVPAVPETGAEAPETGPAFEAPKPAPEPAGETPSPAGQTSNVKGQTSATPLKDATTVAVESILEEGMRETYDRLPPGAKVKFRREGEKAVREIAGMIRSLKVQADRVLDLIRKWLAVIPGVNKFFLVQEAKIKTDKVMAIAEEEKSRRSAAV